jgi:hypothetical protein
MNGQSEQVFPEGRGFMVADREEPLLLWARDRVRKRLRGIEEKGPRFVGAKHLTREEREWMLAEYLIWRMTPEVWRSKTHPRTELDFAGRWGMKGVSSLMWYRRLLKFESLLKEGLKFGISSTERTLDVKNTAHSIVMEQKHLPPKERDARFLSELAKMEGLSKNEPLVTINNVQNSLNVSNIKTLPEAEAVMKDAVHFFTQRGVKSLPPKESTDGPVRLTPVPAEKGQEAR